MNKTKYVIRYRNGGLKPSCRFISESDHGLNYAAPDLNYAKSFDSHEEATVWVNTNYAENLHGRFEVMDLSAAQIALALDS